MDVLPEQDEDDQDTYESVDEFLATRAAGSNTTPSSAPNYAAPPPPGVKPGEHDDHEYTPVKLTDGEIQVKDEPQEDVWGPLPLKIGVSPQPKKRSPSLPHGGVHSTPTNPLRSPSVPHIQTSGMIPAERGLVMASEPSPPPHGKGHDAPHNSLEQPKLPPKKRRELSKLYSESEASKWRGSPPQVPTPVQVVSLCIVVCSHPLPHLLLGGHLLQQIVPICSSPEASDRTSGGYLQSPHYCPWQEGFPPDIPWRISLLLPYCSIL